jgi:hypothetical protein
MKGKDQDGKKVSVEQVVNDEIVDKYFPELKNEANSFSVMEIGSSGLNRWGQNVYEEFLPALRWPRAAKIFKEMASNDPVVTATLLASRQLIRKVTWKVKPASSKRVDKKVAEFIDSCRNDMNLSWGDIIDQITSCFDYGWAYHELVYKKRSGQSDDPTKNSRHDDGLIGWRKIAERSQESWGGWEFDEEDDGSVIGMWQYGNNVSKVLIPIQKALLFRTTVTRSNPEGRSFLRGAYRPYYFKKHIEELEGIGIERDLAGLPVLKAPPGLDIWDPHNEQAVRARTMAEKLIKNVRRDKNEGILLPDGWDFKLAASDGKRQFDTNAVINRLDQRIAITMLADIVMLGADKVGSFALANVKKSLLAAALDAQVQSFANVFNRYAIPRLLALNPFYGLSGLPELVPSPVDCPDIKDLADYISKLAGAKMPLFPDIDLENYLRGVANFPLTAEDAENRVKALEIAKSNGKDSKEGKEEGKKSSKQSKEE